jgi:Ni,Fe-hydrogenase III large subunit
MNQNRARRLQDVLNQLSDVATVTSCRSGEWQIDLETHALASVAFHLAESLGANLAAYFLASEGGTDRLHAVLPVGPEQTYLHLRAPLPADGYCPRLDRHFPVAARYQQEMSGRAGPGRPVGEHPGLEGTGVFQYPLGPVRGDCYETVSFLIDTAGEHIIRLIPSLGYKHRGLEQRAVGLAPELALLLAERAGGTQAAAHGLAFCQALERLADLAVPPRANMLRVVIAELERICGHLLDAGLSVGAAGHVVGAAQLDQLRERFLRLNLTYFGNRYLFGAMAPGGLRRDLSAEQAESLRRAVGQLAADWQRILAMVLATPSIIDRWETTGIVEYGDAWSLAAVGPVGRASGVDMDTRRDHPYAAYGQFPVEVPVYREGDALARFRVRADELAVSFRLVQEALSRLPGGPVQGGVPEVWPGGDALGWVEAPQGETLHWVCIGGGGTIAAYRIRAASFTNWGLFGPAAASGNILQDFPLIDTSFTQSCADCDR